MTTAGPLPWIAPTCEWTPPRESFRCGLPATWHVTTHDFMHENGPGPDSVRLWMMCESCALALLTWAQSEAEQGNGSMCHGCDTLITPMLGGFILAHGELAHPEQDVRYDQ